MLYFLKIRYNDIIIINIKKMEEENKTHECTGDECTHEEHTTDAPATEAPAADMSSCKACSGEEGAEHTCGM